MILGLVWLSLGLVWLTFGAVWLSSGLVRLSIGAGWWQVRVAFLVGELPLLMPTALLQASSQIKPDQVRLTSAVLHPLNGMRTDREESVHWPP